LKFLEKGTRTDIAYATHQPYQCARFSEDTRASHEDAVIYDPKRDQSVEVYADADFCGSWNKATAPQDISTAKSRSGYMVNFAACPIVWTSKLQTQIALSTTEADYISLSQSLWEAIPLMQLVREMNEKNITFYSDVDPKYTARCLKTTVEPCR
jgi:hypothetical protein